MFYVKTTEQLADLLTKALAKAQHTSLTLAVLGHSASTALLAFYADPATRGVCGFRLSGCVWVLSPAFLSFLA